MSVPELPATLRWSPRTRALDPVPEDPSDRAPAPLVIDSWRVEDGRSVALERHEHRFLSSCLARFPDARREQVEGFLAAVRHAVPSTGGVWPRLQAHEGPGGMPVFSVRLRTAPEVQAAAVLWTAPYRSRCHPRDKGPDLGLYGQLRDAAQRHGATDAVLVSGDGAVLETDHSSLVWWRGDRLCAPAPDLRRLSSVTQQVLLDGAAAVGVDIAFEKSRPEDLAGTEVWALNALHGIRLVTSWVGTPAPGNLVRTDRSRSWNERWRTARADMPGR